MGPCLPLSRVVALVGGLALIAAFFMPWFASQNLLLSGHFLNDFLASASASDLQRFMPGTSPTEAQLLRALVDLFPACGAFAAILCLLVTVKPHVAFVAALAVSGIVPLAAWALGVTRLPQGSTSQIGLWLIASGSLAVALGAVFELATSRNRAGANAEGYTL